MGITIFLEEVDYEILAAFFSATSFHLLSQAGFPFFKVGLAVLEIWKKASIEVGECSVSVSKMVGEACAHLNFDSFDSIEQDKP